MLNDVSRSRCILFIHSRKRLTMTEERKGVQDGNTIPGSSILRSSYEPGIREVINNQLVTQTLVFPRCRLVRDFLIPELSYYKALASTSLRLFPPRRRRCCRQHRIQAQSYYFANGYVLHSFIPPIILVHKFLFTSPPPLSSLPPFSLYFLAPLFSISLLILRICKDDWNGHYRTPKRFRYSDIRMQKSDHEKSWETQRQKYYQEFWIKLICMITCQILINSF